MCEIGSNHVSYLSKEHSFIHISLLRQSHRLPKSLKTKFAWDMFPKPNLKNNMSGLAERQTNTLTWQNSPLFSDIYQWAVREKPTCAVMWPASCMSATSAELLMALRECVRGLRERGVEPVSSRGLTWAWWRRGLAGGEQSYQSRVPGNRHVKIYHPPFFTCLLNCLHIWI